MTRIILSVPILLLMFSAPAYGDALCAQISKNQLVEKITATASKWSNMRNSEGSLSFESHRLLQEAQAGLSQVSPPTDSSCPAECKLSKKPKIVIETIPAKFLTDYSDKTKCASYLAQTTAHPLSYPNKLFKNGDEFSSWFSEFSVGSGTDGKQLYASCDGDCSPQYTSIISAANDGLKADVEVVCGHARDKDDNNYILVSSYRWECV